MCESSSPKRAAVGDKLSMTGSGGWMLTSTVSQPNVQKMITAVAAILHDQILADTEKPYIEERPEWRVFDEETYCEGERNRVSLVSFTAVACFKPPEYFDAKVLGVMLLSFELQANRRGLRQAAFLVTRSPHPSKKSGTSSACCTMLLNIRLSATCWLSCSSTA